MVALGGISNNGLVTAKTGNALECAFHLGACDVTRHAETNSQPGNNVVVRLKKFSLKKCLQKGKREFACSVIVLPGQGLAARVKKLSLLSWRILI
jgi:hypothetical protein